MADDPKQNTEVAAKASELASAILAFRDAANARPDFVKYKVLVGFESVYPGHWEDKEFDFRMADKYRNERAQEYIASIDTLNENEWFAFLTRCSQTNSNDMATFPVFGQFIVNLAKAKPEIAERMLLKAGEELRRFMPGFLNGLAVSDRRDIYDRSLEREFEQATNLSGLARHLRYSDVKLPTLASRILDKALTAKDDIAVIECLLFCMEQFGEGKIDDEEKYFSEALAYLNERKDARWVNEAWFLHGKNSKFFETLTEQRAALLLEAFFQIPRMAHQVERLLKRVAERRLEDVWNFFGRRVSREKVEGEEKYEAVPFSFHGLEKELSRNPAMAISKGLSWYQNDKRLFQFRGGRVLSNTFPSCSSEFANALIAAIETGGPEVADFALSVLQNYSGEQSCHGVLKTIVASYPADSSKMTSVRIAVDNTGVVSGEFGMADAYRSRKGLLKDWLTDEREAVRKFAEQHIRELDNSIASETRRAEEAGAMRRLNFKRPDEGDE